LGSSLLGSARLIDARSLAGVIPQVTVGAKGRGMRKTHLVVEVGLKAAAGFAPKHRRSQFAPAGAIGLPCRRAKVWQSGET